MPAKSYTDAERATAVALVRLTTVDQTATTLNIDRRTLRSWLASAPPAEDADAWRAAQQLAQQQLLTGLATGKVKHPTFLATIAGIAARNIRFAELLKRRRDEGQPEPELPAEPEPVREVLGALRDDQRQLMVASIDLRLGQLGEPELPEPTSEAELPVVLAWIAEYAMLDEAQVAAALTDVRAELSASHRAASVRGRLLDGPIDKERWMVNVTPEPAAAALQGPPVTVLEAGEHLEDHPTWRHDENG